MMLASSPDGASYTWGRDEVNHPLVLGSTAAFSGGGRRQAG
jgi:hypothetical protein